jgi:hypothetical protein
MSVGLRLAVDVILPPWDYGGSNFQTYLLDTYTGAKAAYSVRKLRKLFYGPCVRLRRSTDNAESDFGFYNGWLDLNSIYAWHSTPGNISIAKWYDQSGNGLDMTQATAAQQPVYQTAVTVLNNKPGFLFNAASSQFLSRAQDVLSTGNTPCTILAVASRGATEASRQLVSIGDDTGTGKRPSLQTTTTNLAPMHGYSGGNASAANNTWTNNAGAAVGGRNTGTINVVLISAVTVTVAAALLSVGSSDACIGKRAGTASANPWDGVVSEVLIWNNSSVDWLSIHANQRTIFNV